MKLIYTLLNMFFIPNYSRMYEPITLNMSNSLFITGEINQLSTDYFIGKNKLLELDNTDIFIYINSPGGNVYEGMRIIENIKYLNSIGFNISCIAQNAYSMAFTVFQFCPNKFITSTSTLMQHKLYLETGGYFENIKNYIHLIDKISNDLENEWIDKLNITKKEFYEKIRDDWWIHGRDILEWYLADKIVTIGCHKDLIGSKIYLNDKLTEYIGACPLFHPIS